MNTAVSSIARSTLIIAPCGADAHGEDSRDRRNVHGPGRTGRATSDIPSVPAFATRVHMLGQSKLDYIDRHGYWDHPQGEGNLRWNIATAQFHNLPMVKD